MLNKIHIHKAQSKSLWFKSAHCAKLLGRRPDSLLRQVCVKKINGQNYISEETFKNIFKNNEGILAQLTHYKLTGEIPTIDCPVLIQQSLQRNKGFVYVFEDTITKQYKIGITGRDIAERLKELNQCPGANVVAKYISPATDKAAEIENKLHRFFKHKRIIVLNNPTLKEWFDLSAEEYTILLALLEYEFIC